MATEKILRRCGISPASNCKPVVTGAFLRNMRSRGSKKVIYVAVAANLAIASVKFAAATLTKSSAMMAEVVHSTVDTGNELLLLLGMSGIPGHFSWRDTP